MPTYRASIWGGTPRVRALVTRAVAQPGRDDEERRALREEEFLARVQAAVAQLEARGAAVTRQAVGDILGFPPTSFSSHLQALALLKEGAQRARLEREMRAQQGEVELVGRVEEAIHDLRALGKPVTQWAVGEALGMDRRTLGTYEGVRRLLEQFANHAHYQSSRQQSQRLEEELVMKVETAIQQLEAFGQTVTQRGVQT